MRIAYTIAIDFMGRAITFKSRVGCVLVMKNGVHVPGFNVENRCHKGYHAEETAFISALLSGFKGEDFEEIILSYDFIDKGTYPMCGHCRQLIWEYTKNPDIKITVIDTLGEEKYTGTLGELYPMPYPR